MYELYTLKFPNGKRYIGVSSNAKARFRQHKCSARKGKHHPLSAAIRKHGESTVICEVLCVGEVEYIRDLEIKAIAAFSTQDAQFGYNISGGGDKTTLGLRRTLGPANPAHRAALSRASKGVPKSAEHKAALSRSHSGTTLSDDRKLTISTTLTGRPKSPEHCARIRAAKLAYWAARRAKQEA